MERQTHGRTAGQRSPLALLVGSWPRWARWALGYTSNTFITSARVTDGKCAYSSFVARSPHPASPASPHAASQPVSRLSWPYVIRKGKRTNENFPIIADTARTRPQRKFNALNCPRPTRQPWLGTVTRRPPFAARHFSCSLSKCRILDERKSFVNVLIYPIYKSNYISSYLSIYLFISLSLYLAVSVVYLPRLCCTLKRSDLTCCPPFWRMSEPAVDNKFLAANCDTL